MKFNSNNAFFLGVKDIYSPDFSFMSLQYDLCPWLRLGHKSNWRAINEKSRAINIYNARKDSVIVMFEGPILVITLEPTLVRPEG